MRVYPEDILIYARTEEEFPGGKFNLVLQRLDKHQITTNSEKVFLSMSSVEFERHTIDDNDLSFSREKIDKGSKQRTASFRPTAEKFPGCWSIFQRPCMKLH